MIRTVIVAAGLVLGLTSVMAQGDPIAERKNVMKAVGGATRDGAAIVKGEAPFDAAKAQAVFKIYVDAAKKLPGLYPDSSKSGGDTSASPKIWEDAAGFKAAVAKFETDATAGITAATSLDGFKAAFGAATRNCASCHEVYRVKK